MSRLDTSPKGIRRFTKANRNSVAVQKQYAEVIDAIDAELEDRHGKGYALEIPERLTLREAKLEPRGSYWNGRGHRRGRKPFTHRQLKEAW